MISASALARVIACPGSEALPQVKRHSTWADSGIARHLYLSTVGKVGKEKALLTVDEEHRQMCEDIDLTGLPTKLAPEVAFAWNWRTGEARELGREMNRDYSKLKPNEIPGTIDALGLSSGSAYLGDYKGFNYVKAKENPQLLFAAMCASKVYNKDSAVLEIINIRDGKNFRNKAIVDAFDLADFEMTLQGAIGRVVKLQKKAAVAEGLGPVPVTEGEHCRYCPAFDACPAKMGLLRQMMKTSGSSDLIRITSENAFELYSKYLQMKAMLNKVQGAIFGYASEFPIPLGEGRVFGARTKKGNEQLDGDITYEVIRAQLGQGPADMAVTRKATKAGITRAVKAQEHKGPVAPCVERILEEVRLRNGSTKKEGTVVDEHKE